MNNIYTTLNDKLAPRKFKNYMLLINRIFSANNKCPH